MKYRTNDYAEAFVATLSESSKSDQNAIVTKFCQTVRKNGDWNFIEKIVDAIERKIVRNDNGRMVVAEFARESNKKQFTKLIESKDAFRMFIKPELVGGARITINGNMEADYSFQRKLKKLFSRHVA